MAFVIMLGVWGTMILGAWLWGRRQGFRARYLDSWAFDPDEAVLWRDDRADIVVVPTMNRAAIIRPMRLHRARVLATPKRVIVATPELFTRKPRVIYVLHLGAAPAGIDTGTTGGLFKTGYQALVVERGGIALHPRPSKPSLSYLAFRPDRAVLSSFGCAEFRIYTDKLDSFPIG